MVLKAPLEKGTVRLFDQAPLVSGNRDTRRSPGSGPDIMVAKFLSGEAKIGILPPNIAAKHTAFGSPCK
ncbi:hypothetical protein MASR2M78_01340 [Treponema sp.]